MSKIFLVGRRRTGIKSIIKALEIVGFKKGSILKTDSPKTEELIKNAEKYDVIAVVRDYQVNDIRAIEAAYPDSRFVLTKRPSDIWYASFVRYFSSLTGNYPQTVHSNKGHFVSKYYEEYNKEVGVYFYGRDWKLLTINMDGTQNWQTFCSYFKASTPKVSFPHLNRS